MTDNKNEFDRAASFNREDTSLNDYAIKLSSATDLSYEDQCDLIDSWYYTTPKPYTDPLNDLEYTVIVDSLFKIVDKIHEQLKIEPDTVFPVESFKAPTGYVDNPIDVVALNAFCLLADLFDPSRPEAFTNYAKNIKPFIGQRENSFIGQLALRNVAVVFNSNDISTNDLSDKERNAIKSITQTIENECSLYCQYYENEDAPAEQYKKGVPLNNIWAMAALNSQELPRLISHIKNNEGDLQYNMIKRRVSQFPAEYTDKKNNLRKAFPDLFPQTPGTSYGKGNHP